MDILLASQNEHKHIELSKILSEHNVLLPSSLGIEFHCEEDGKTYFENSYKKALALHRLTKKPVLADDSGLSIPALNGAPGIYSARYGSENGKNLSTNDRNLYLLNNMKDIKDRAAFFVCSMVLLINEYTFFAAQETVEGSITLTPSGTEGFGYDPVFYLPNYNKTMAEISDTEKNKISHRGKATEKIKLILNTL